MMAIVRGISPAKPHHENRGILPKLNQGRKKVAAPAGKWRFIFKDVSLSRPALKSINPV
jgi:hypothetical protein